MHRMTGLAVSIVAILFLAPELTGQACLGLPGGSRGAIGGTTTFRDHARTYGVSGMTTSDSNLYLVGEAGITAYDVDIENETMVAATLAQEIEPLQQTASVCPFAGAGYAFGTGYSQVTVPVGIAIGKTLPLGNGGSATLTPHVSPQFVWARDRINRVDQTIAESYFGVSAGGTIGIGQVVAGFGVSRIFEEGSPAVLGIRAGFAF
jgi:hypothetical protein